MKLAVSSLLFKGHQLIITLNEMLKLDILKWQTLIYSCPFHSERGKLAIYSKQSVVSNQMGKKFKKLPGLTWEFAATDFLQIACTLHKAACWGSPL